MNNGNNHNKATYNKIDLKDRTAIELGLCRKESIKEISVITRHDRSSIAREIKAGTPIPPLFQRSSQLLRNEFSNSS